MVGACWAHITDCTTMVWIYCWRIDIFSSFDSTAFIFYRPVPFLWFGDMGVSQIHPFIITWTEGKNVSICRIIIQIKSDMKHFGELCAGSKWQPLSATRSLLLSRPKKPCTADHVMVEGNHYKRKTETLSKMSSVFLGLPADRDTSIILLLCNPNRDKVPTCLPTYLLASVDSCYLTLLLLLN